MCVSLCVCAYLPVHVNVYSDCVCVCIQQQYCLWRQTHDGCALRKSLIYNDSLIVVLIKCINRHKCHTLHFLGWAVWERRVIKCVSGTLIVEFPTAHFPTDTDSPGSLWAERREEVTKHLNSRVCVHFLPHFLGKH